MAASDTIRVLCVEDEAHDRELIRHALEKEAEGFEMLEATDQTSFRARLAEEDFDVVLTDFDIIGFEGLEVVREVKRLRPNMPVIVVTGTGTEEIAVRALKEGADDYVIKTPRHIAQLPHTILHALQAARNIARLRETEASIMAVVENTADGVLVVDEQGTILFANPVSEQLLGAPPQGLISAHFDYPIEDGSSLEADLPKRLGGPGAAEIRVADTVWDGKNCRVVTMRDITERKVAESALAESAERLRQSQKMEALGQLAGGIAHDFNNLLTAIIGYSDLLYSSPELAGSPAREDIAEIRRAAERAGSLTKQILAFSRRQALQPTLVSLNSVLAGMEPLLRRTLGEQVDFCSLMDPNLGMTEVDIHQFEQVIMNLAINARDAMPYGGTLAIATTNAEFGPQIDRSPEDLPPGRYVVMSVSDNGVGMDEETRARMFEPFFTTKAPGTGTGLGLSTVYGIVKQSGGGVTVETQPGKGTSVTILLPRVSEPAPHIDSLAAATVPSPGNETILLVEDESSLRLLVGRILGALNYKVLSAATAEEAFELFEDCEHSVDLLLTDVVLPGEMQGDDLARALVAARPDLPVLYMSGYARNAVLPTGRADEKVDCLEKPFRPETLTGRVRQALSRGRG